MMDLVSQEVCNILVTYDDNVLPGCAPGCGGNAKTLRTWTILDWCQSVTANYVQTIKVVDDFGPQLAGLGNFEVSVDPWECNADVLVPAPTLRDNCDNDLTYSIGFVEGALQVTGNAADGYVINNVPVGTTSFQYVAEDCCGNRSTRTVNVTVADKTAPVPVTKQNLIVELTRVSGEPGQISTTVVMIAVRQ